MWLMVQEVSKAWAPGFLKDSQVIENAAKVESQRSRGLHFQKLEFTESYIKQRL